MAPPVGEEEEKKHFLRILQAFRNYNRDAKGQLISKCPYENQFHPKYQRKYF